MLVSRLRGVARRRSASRGTTPATRSSPTGSTSRSSTTGIAAAERSVAAGDALVGAAGRHDGPRPRARAAACPRRRARGSTARGRRSERTVAATRLLAAEAALVVGRPGRRGRRWRRGASTTIPTTRRPCASLMRGARRRSAGRRRRWPPTPRCGPAWPRTSACRPSAETEALHAEILLARARAGAGGGAGRPPRSDGIRSCSEPAPSWPPPTSTPPVATPSEAVRRGAGAGALEVAGWVAYYDRDFRRALRFAERGRAHRGRRRAAHERADAVRSGPALRGDLAGAERDLEAAVQSTGRRASGARARCGWATCACTRAGSTEAIELSARGAVDAAAMRHPFVIPHAMLARVYALGALGPRRRGARRAGVARHDPRRARPAGDRFRPVVDNFWGWILGGDRPDRRGPRAPPPRPRHARAASPSRGTTRCSTWPWRRSRRRTPPPPRPWLAQVEVPPDEAGAMAWHQRQRQRLLEARVALLEGDPPTAAPLAAWVRDDAARRGAPRGRRPGRGRAAPRRRRRPGPCRRRGGRRHGRRASTSSPASRPGGSPPAWPPPPAAPTSGPPPSATPSSSSPPAAPTPTASAPGPRASSPASRAATALDRAARRRQARAVRTIMRRTRGSGSGPRSSRARASTLPASRRRRATATNGATWAMPSRQATRSAGVEVGERDLDRAATSASRPARAATADARRRRWRARGIDVGLQLVDPRLGGPARPRRRRGRRRPSPGGRRRRRRPRPAPRRRAPTTRAASASASSGSGTWL